MRGKKWEIAPYLAMPQCDGCFPALALDMGAPGTTACGLPRGSHMPYSPNPKPIDGPV
jgi:hypothetical protein